MTYGDCRKARADWLAFFVRCAASAASTYLFARDTGSSAPAGGVTRLDVRVPNERDDKGTTKVAVQFPSGFEHASYEPAAGWDVEVEHKGDFVDTITWTAQSERDAIAPASSATSASRSACPRASRATRSRSRRSRRMPAVRSSAGIGPADGDEPAPQVTLTEAEEHGAVAHSGDEEAAAPAPAASGDDGGSDTLAIVALAIGVLGLLAGAAGLLVARRSPGKPAVE
jgi:hypothetical protein